MESSTGAVTIKFVSDDFINKMGFNLQYVGLTDQPDGNGIIFIVPLYAFVYLQVCMDMILNWKKTLRLL